MMKVPVLDDPKATRFLNELLTEVDRRDKDKMYSNTANRALLLQTPDKTKVYEVTISNGGTLVLTKVSG